MPSTATTEIAAWLTAPVLPWVAAATALEPRWRADWRQRWGLEVPPVQPGATWIAASSVGEVRAAAALAAALDGPVLVTADTDTGASVARGLVRVAGRKPVDHPWTLAPVWAEARPARVVWVEGCWWPALDGLARRDGVPTVRVNARPGPGGARRLALGLEADRVIARDSLAARWFHERGCPAEIGGELKNSAPLPTNPLRWERPFAVACSTRPGDEAFVIEGRGDLPWLIAPRHLERIDEVGALLGGTRWVRRAALVDGVVPSDVDVVLLDSFGELGGCLAGASLAFIGGTLDPLIGGHSPVEAWRQGVPVVCGQHRHGQGDAFSRAGARVVLRPSELATLVRNPPGAAVPPTSNAAARVAGLMGPAGPMAPESAPRPWARGLAALHKSGRGIWHGAWDRGVRAPVRVGVPVVSIGSANARSPGRTSTVRWMLEELARRGWRPGVATRGYRRLGGGLACSWVTGAVEQLGDEGTLLARSGWPVAVSSDRVGAARALEAHGVDVIVLDDGLQHRRLHRDLDLVVVDARYPMARGEIPMGEGREQPLPGRAHGVIVHHAEPGRGSCEAVAHREVGSWHLGPVPRPEGPPGPVAAIAGIGRPADFLASLEVEVARFRALPDHAPIDVRMATDLLRWAGPLPLVCTEKDYVRMPSVVAGKTWWRTVRLTVSGAQEWWFDLLEHA